MGTTSVAEKHRWEFSDRRRALHTFIGEPVDRFIIGDLNLDAQWDACVVQCVASGA